MSGLKRLQCFGLFCSLIMGCGAETDGFGGTSYPIRIVADAQVSSDVGPIRDAGTIGVNGAFLGHWAQRQVLAGITDLPVFGPTYSETVGTFKWQVIPDEDGVLVLVETCSVVLRRTEDAVTTVIPQQFIDALPISVRPANIEDGALNVRYFIEPNGVRLDNPEEDTLPTDAADPRVYDQDGDGKPGLTVIIAGIIDGEVQVVQRTRTRHQGTLSDGAIRGIVGWRADEEILGADNDILKQGASVEPHVDPEKSWFVARPIDAEQSCAEILGASDTLFPEDTGIQP